MNTRSLSSFLYVTFPKLLWFEIQWYQPLICGLVSFVLLFLETSKHLPLMINERGFFFVNQNWWNMSVSINSSIISSDSVRITGILASLNQLDVLAIVFQNLQLISQWGDDHFWIAWLYKVSNHDTTIARNLDSFLSHISLNCILFLPFSVFFPGFWIVLHA